MSKSEILDKQPPSDKSIEASLLSCILAKPGIFPAVAQQLTVDSFWDPSHKRLFASMLACKNAHEPAEARFVQPKFHKIDDKSHVVIADLIQAKADINHWKSYCEKLRQLASQRSVIENAVLAIQAAYSGSPTESLVRAIAKHGAQNRSKTTTLRAANELFADGLEKPKATVIPFGIDELDKSLGGGVEPGEVVILAGRPSHGKSAIALQAVHYWTGIGLPAIFISEEMSAESLGKRTTQYASDIQVHNWKERIVELRAQISEHFDGREECYIVEHCNTADVAADHIRLASKESGVRVAVIDYTQLLNAPGKNRYEQITNTSICLRQVANETKVVLLALCQLNREIEKREAFIPKLSDLRETGQLEQDADVIIFGVWPHRINNKQPPNEYKFFVAKNRNRGIETPVINCRFEPMRQRFSARQPQDEENYEHAFDAFKD